MSEIFIRNRLLPLLLEHQNVTYKISKSNKIIYGHNERLAEFIYTNESEWSNTYPTCEKRLNAMPDKPEIEYVCSGRYRIEHVRRFEGQPYYSVDDVARKLDEVIDSINNQLGE